ncbi:hypothetical protein GCM10009409_37720 [Shewanella saliphila]|uniref:Transposase n=1 Tax=Shewanella saliphila TaxID=2282698 RepID=A0ABQ2QD34_9GAMM|nr:hypothetical protein GCM10009409_37720 [Shewanella saliphila]
MYKSTKVQKYKSTKVQKYKSTKVQKYKSTKVQKYKANTWIPAQKHCRDDNIGVSQLKIIAGMIRLVNSISESLLG